MIFNGKFAGRIVRKDSIAVDSTFIPKTQEVDCQDEENNARVTVGDTKISSDHHRSSNGNTSAIFGRFRFSLERFDKQFFKIEDHLTGISYSKSTTNSNSCHAKLDNFYTELLKI